MTVACYLDFYFLSEQCDLQEFLEYENQKFPPRFLKMFF